MRILSCVVFGVAAFVCAGCGPKLVDIRGKVTYNGQPPREEGLHITFVGCNRAEVMASIGPDGEYLAKGVVSGPNNIVVFYHDPLRITRDYVSVSKYRKFPEIYADVAKSKLTFDATEGGVFNADLTGPELK